MAEIKVTVSELRSKAGELRNLNSQFKTKVGELESAEQNLASMWEGDAKTAFHTAFTNDKTQMDNFYNLMEQYIITLENIATEYENKEMANAQIASTRSY
ncbi:MAG: WXG100 family type VII secretion target [Lachnospiraceae bacterium]|nr:WXG100 family type VII secretion target [Lachnospiraceae bacterium]